MDYTAKNMNHHLMANLDVGRMILLPHHHHHVNNTIIGVKKQIIVKLLLDAPIFVATLHHHNVIMKMTMAHMTSWKVLAHIEDPLGHVVIAMNNKLMRVMLLKVTTTMTIKNKNALTIINKHVKVATIMTKKIMSVITTNAMKTMSVINTNIMKAKSVKEVSAMKLAYNVIINYILMTTDAILIMSKGATKVLKIAMALTWRMNLVSATTDTMMMTI